MVSLYSYLTVKAAVHIGPTCRQLLGAMLVSDGNDGRQTEKCRLRKYQRILARSANSVHIFFHCYKLTKLHYSRVVLGFQPDKLSKRMNIQYLSILLIIYPKQWILFANVVLFIIDHLVKYIFS